MSTKERLIPGPDHPITVAPTGKHVVVKAGGKVIAETDNALTLHESNYPPVQGLPLQDVPQRPVGIRKRQLVVLSAIRRCGLPIICRPAPEGKSFTARRPRSSAQAGNRSGWR